VVVSILFGVCPFGDEEGKKEGSDLFSWPRCSWLWLESFTPSVLFRGGWKWRSRFISFFPFALFFPSHLVKSNYFGIFFRLWPILFFITFFLFRYLRHSFLHQCYWWPMPLRVARPFVSIDQSKGKFYTNENE
jgi:hypothetical protein